MNLEEEEKQMVGIDQAGQDCDLSGHCQDFFQCDSSIQNKICSQNSVRGVGSRVCICDPNMMSGSENMIIMWSGL